MKLEGLFSVFGHVARGLTGELTRLESVSQNISNANQVAGEGEPIYRRKTVDPESFKEQYRSRLRGKSLDLSRNHMAHLKGIGQGSKFKGEEWPEAKIIESNGERLIFDPSHPKANPEGYVRMPDVNVVNEMMDMITSTRSYEANTSVMSAAKQIAKRTLEI